MSSDDERPPKTLLQPLSSFQTLPVPVTNVSATSSVSSPLRTPYQITFPTREAEIHYLQPLMNACSTFDGTVDQFTTWFKETSLFVAKQGYPETDHPYIIRHLLTDEALDFYLAHEDLVFNLCDLRKLFLRKQDALAPLRSVSSLDSIASLTLSADPPAFASTRVSAPAPLSVTHPVGTSCLSFAQSLEDLTQHDIRKTIIEDLQRNTSKFTGDHRQDILKWLRHIEGKFETAGIPDSKKFDLISQLLDKGALDWFREHKVTFHHSWTDFLTAFKDTFDSPNRARIALQKLHSYTQSPHQDVRSFCREMRKLFREADPAMSSNMKLELLLAKIHPSFRLDLLKQKPTTPDEFETMAKDLENTYLVFSVIEQNLSPSSSLPRDDSYSSFVPSSVASQRLPYLPSQPSSPRSYAFSSVRRAPNSHSGFRASSRFTDHAHPHSSQSSASRSSFPAYRSAVSSHTRSHARPSLFTYQSPAHSSASPSYSSSSSVIPPLMPPSSSVYPNSASHSSSATASSPYCRLCSSVDHSDSNCPF